MTRNWQQAGWPRFRYDAKFLEPLEAKFLLAAGQLIGAARHIDQTNDTMLRIELLSEEAVKTSAIEGKFLERMSVQSSSGNISDWSRMDAISGHRNAASRM